MHRSYCRPFVAILALITPTVLAEEIAGHITIPLVQNPGNDDYTASHAAQAVFKHAARFGAKSEKYNVEPEELIGGFWYGSFDIGDSKNVSLLVDTGSSDVFLNPGLYSPSTDSKNLHKLNVANYITAQTNGCGNATITAHVFTDTVSAAGLVSKNQTFGMVIKETPPNNGTVTRFPRQGLVGMSGVKANYTLNESVPWFRNLCDQGQVHQCRFGLAFGTEGKGRQILGGVDRSLFDGELVHPARAPYDLHYVDAVVDDSKGVVFNRSVTFDSGTANIVAPLEDAKQVFKALGIQAVEQHTPGCATVVFGYYKCDSPPKVGFRMVQSTSSSNSDGNSSTVFNVEPSAFKLKDNGNNNCIATLVGANLTTADFPFWIIGQAWFQGKYVSQDAAQKTVGVATLKDKTISSG